GCGGAAGHVVGGGGGGAVGQHRLGLAPGVVVAVGGDVVGRVGDRGGLADVVVAVRGGNRRWTGDRGQPAAGGVVGVVRRVRRGRRLPYQLGGGCLSAQVVVGGLSDGAGRVGGRPQVTLGAVGVVRHPAVRS